MLGIGRAGLALPPGVALPPTAGILIGQSSVAVAAPADVTEDTLATITVPAGAIGANGLIELIAAFSVTNNVNVKTLRVRYSGAAGTIISTFVLTSQPSGLLVLTMGNRNAQNSQISTSSIAFGTANQSAVSGPTTSAVDSSAATTMVITGQKATAGDTFQIESFQAQVYYKP